ncbi:MAG: hypothetical protein Q9178_002879 [Gyalolechia marmorata]
MSKNDTQRISPDDDFANHPSNQSPNGDPTIASPIVQPIADPQPSLRSRLSRQFGLSRLPRQARAKSLTRPRPGQQQTQDSLNYQQPPHITQNGRDGQTRKVRRAASTPTVSHPAEPSPRFIGLEDRRAKVPVAIPTFVRRVKFQLSTDRTMATRGSGSGPAEPTSELNDTASEGCQSVDARSGTTGEASMMDVPGKKKSRGLWTLVKRKAKMLLRRKEAGEH